MLWILHIFIDEVNWADRSIWVLEFWCLERTSFAAARRVKRFRRDARLVGDEVFGLFLILDLTVTTLDQRCSSVRLSFLKLCDGD